MGARVLVESGLQGRQDGGVGRGRVEDWHALVALGAELRGHAGAEAGRVRPVNGTELQDAVVLVGGPLPPRPDISKLARHPVPLRDPGNRDAKLYISPMLDRFATPCQRAGGRT